MMDLGQTASVMYTANVEATKASATIIAGKTLNNRVVNIIGPKLPYMVRGFVTESEVGKALLCNAVSAALVAAMPNNEKLMLATEAMIGAANLTLAESFNIEQMIDELMKDIEFPSAPSGPVAL